MRTLDFDYNLPDSAIASHPLAKRTDSRLLVLNRREGCFADHAFCDIRHFFKAGDVLVLNNTRVMPARWFGKKQSGGKIECLIERITALPPFPRAQAHIRASHAPKLGSEVILTGGVTAVVMAKTLTGLYELQFNTAESLIELLHMHGEIPLPPYITREVDAKDALRYQTVYAEHVGAVAAPTAGLHFDEVLLAELQTLGVEIATITLHVGAGTFQPVRAEYIQDHVMHAEWFDVNHDACEKINQATGRVIAVGTTVVRTLETLALKGQALRPCQGESQLFITPGFTFNIVDAMITNFHLPRSTLLMLVSAFAGHQHVMNAYQHAIDQGYRFYSYGDAMFIHG